MSVQLYQQVSFSCSKVITERYSTSFSLGIKAFDKRFRDPIYAIYGFVRLADEVVDTFHEYQKEILIDEFYQDTYRAIANGISLNPVLNSFQEVVNRYNIEPELIDAFIESMKMDLSNQRYSQSKYKAYIYGSAEVVGLMCLAVFCETDTGLYKELKSGAMRLGSAFQKVNFLRDMKADFEERGRTYFPGKDFLKFNDVDKKEIEQDIKEDFDVALSAIKRLPAGTRLGVYIAYRYYMELFRKISNARAIDVIGYRIRVNDTRKAWLFAKATLRNQLNIIQ